MGLRKYLKQEYAIMKDDLGINLDYVKIDRTKEIFNYGKGNNAKTYNVIRKDAYIIREKGYGLVKIYYLYNVNNPNPLRFDNTDNCFKPIISPELYNRMIENEILIKLNTLNKKIDFKMILIIVVIAIIGYLAYASGMFGVKVLVNASMNITNMTNTTKGNFTNYGMIRNDTVHNVSNINLSALKGVPT